MIWAMVGTNELDLGMSYGELRVDLMYAAEMHAFGLPLLILDRSWNDLYVLPLFP